MRAVVASGRGALRAQANFVQAKTTCAAASLYEPAANADRSAAVWRGADQHQGTETA